MSDGVIAPAEPWDEGEVLCRREHELAGGHRPGHVRSGRGGPGADGMGASVPLTAVEVEPSTASLRCRPRPIRSPTASATRTPVTAAGKSTCGFDVVRTADALEVTLLWQAQVTPQIPYKVFVHLLNADGELVAQSDAEPAGGYSTTTWLPGEVVADTHRIPLPPAAAEQPLTLAVGLYDPAGGARRGRG
ncbi:MAG: hypothetical protein R2838_04725 [Caldilineaceae bacterium]